MTTSVDWRRLAHPQQLREPNQTSLTFRRKKPISLSFEEIQIVQLIVQQSVLATEALEKTPQEDLSWLACEMADGILKEMGLVAPTALLETLVDASFQLSRELQVRKLRPVSEPVPIDISIKRNSNFAV